MRKPDTHEPSTTPAAAASAVTAPAVPADPYGWRSQMVTRADRTFCDRAGFLVRSIGNRPREVADDAVELERECFRMVVAAADLYKPTKRCRDAWVCALSAFLLGDHGDW